MKVFPSQEDIDIQLALTREATEFTSSPSDFRELAERLGHCKVVLIGEATHGTHEFYEIRSEITKRLIANHGFNIVAIEGDFPDAQRVNCYVKGGQIKNASDALHDFDRFPAWMWRNRVMHGFVEWLQGYNSQLAGRKQTGVYGLDLYSLFTSMDAVIRYLDEHDPVAKQEVVRKYNCFERFDRDAQHYGALSASRPRYLSCEGEVIDVLISLRNARSNLAPHPDDDESHFFAIQNARIVANAEHYYRQMYQNEVSTWNLRDSHMMDSLESIIDFVLKQSGSAKAVVWAHNSHIGNAHFTEMGRREETNLGELVKNRYGDKAYLLGLTTYEGTVTAADNWGDAPQIKRVRPAMRESFEWLLHGCRVPSFFVDLKSFSRREELAHERLERAIGVIYRPDTERWSHYFHANLAQQFDGLIHIDLTTHLVPLKRSKHPLPEEDVPETYPFAM